MQPQLIGGLDKTPIRWLSWPGIHPNHFSEQGDLLRRSRYRLTQNNPNHAFRAGRSR
jgi:hypothetical protein